MTPMEQQAFGDLPFGEETTRAQQAKPWLKEFGKVQPRPPWEFGSTRYPLSDDVASDIPSTVQQKSKAWRSKMSKIHKKNREIREPEDTTPPCCAFVGLGRCCRDLPEAESNHLGTLRGVMLICCLFKLIQVDSCSTIQSCLLNNYWWLPIANVHKYNTCHVWGLLNSLIRDRAAVPVDDISAHRLYVFKPDDKDEFILALLIAHFNIPAWPAFLLCDTVEGDNKTNNR